jgi:hypothetical protein
MAEELVATIWIIWSFFPPPNSNKKKKSSEMK